VVVDNRGLKIQLMPGLVGKTESVERAFGPIERADRRRLAIAVAGCPDPADKYCDCRANKIADEIIARLHLVGERVEPG
jgi:hypothetical protein